MIEPSDPFWIYYGVMMFLGGVLLVCALVRVAKWNADVDEEVRRARKR